jgi:hypothetical protein
MAKRILMLDDTGAAGIVYYMSGGLGCKIDLALNLNEARGYLKEHSKEYALILVEPFFWMTQEDASPLRDFLAETIDIKGIYVVVHSTQDLPSICEKTNLFQGTHFDKYIYKKSEDSPKKIKTLWEKLNA